MSEPIWTEQQLLAKIAALEESSALDKKSCSEAWELEGARKSEILKLRARVKVLEDAIRKAVDFGDGHAWWDSEGNAKIETGGFNLLRETLKETI